MALDYKECLNELKNWRETYNLKTTLGREKLIQRVVELSETLQKELPELRDYFRRDEMDILLLESVNHTVEERGLHFIKFVVSCGYKDQPLSVETTAKTVVRRTTGLHLAVRIKSHTWIETLRMLFEIYDSFNVNYADSIGLTHFHVACVTDFVDIVEKFLDHGADPNFFPDAIVDPPLHLALNMNNLAVAELLLRRGADPNLPNRFSLTPLHVICQRGHRLDDDNAAQMLFDIGKEKNRTVQIEAEDMYHRTPLHCAVLNLLPNTTDILLANGADLSNFVFPHMNEFAERWEKLTCGTPPDFRIRLALGALGIVRSLASRGYDLDLSYISMLTGLLMKGGVFEDRLSDQEVMDEQLVSRAKNTSFGPQLTLYDLMFLPRDEAVSKLHSSARYYLGCYLYSLNIASGYDVSGKLAKSDE